MKPLPFFRTTLASVSLASVLAVTATAQNAAPEPGMRFGVDLGAIMQFAGSMVPPDNAEFAQAATMIQASGVTRVRMAMFPDEEKGMVGVVGAAGNTTAMKNLYNSIKGEADFQEIADSIKSLGGNRYEVQMEGNPQAEIVRLVETDGAMLVVPDSDAYEALELKTLVIDDLPGGFSRMVDMEFDLPDAKPEAGWMQSMIDKNGGIPEGDEAAMVAGFLPMVEAGVGALFKHVEGVDKMAMGMVITEEGNVVVDYVQTPKAGGDPAAMAAAIMSGGPVGSEIGDLISQGLATDGVDRKFMERDGKLMGRISMPMDQAPDLLPAIFGALADPLMRDLQEAGALPQ